MSCSIIINTLSKHEQEQIRRALTIIEKVESFAGKSKNPTIISMIHYENEKEVHLPFSFCTLYYKKFLNDSISYPESNITFLGSLRDYQKPIVQKAIEDLKEKSSVTLAVYPGFGKTVISAAISSILKLKTVIIVNVKTLVKQWINTFQNYTSCRICVVNGSVFSNKLLNSDEEFDVYICMAKQVKNIKELRRIQIGHVVFDEAHLLCTKSNVKTWLYFKPKYITVLTATPDRDDGFDVMSQLVAGNHVIYRQNDSPFTVIKYLTHIIPEKKIFIKDKEGTVISEEIITYPDMISKLNLNQTRNEIVLNIILQNPSKKILVLTKRIEHCNTLKNLFQENEISSDTLCGNKKEYIDGSVLIGTVPKIGTGFDQDSFCDSYDGIKFNFLIIACYIKKNNLLNQCVGRVFRADNPVIVQLVDENRGFKTIWGKNLKWYRERSAEMREIK